MHCSWCPRYDLFAVALPPLRPAAFFCAVVPPCDELLREELDEPDFLPPRLDAPEEFAIFAARSFDMPLSFSASYCFSFLTLLLLLGMTTNFPSLRENHLMSSKIRRLEPGDASVFVQHSELLADPHAILLVAFDGDEPVGFVLAHDLPRRHGKARQLFVYEVEVAESHRRRGIARSLLERLAELARERGISDGFVLTEPDNGAANGLYGGLGGVRSDVVMWDFEYGAD
jgi:GNAT superfamily N-acetyltransferase